MSDDQGYEVSGGNVFADLGHPDPETALAKVKLAQRIAVTIDRRGWTQAQAATVLGIDQPKVSALVRGRLREFSTDRLLRLLVRLDLDVDIRVVAKSPLDRPARISVSDETDLSEAPSDLRPAPSER